MKPIIIVVLAIVAVLFILIQFIPRDHNQSTAVPVNDITTVYKVPPDVQAVFKKACYDCHSNNTNYPFYARIQPMRYMMDMHVAAGKDELNFNEFGTYSSRKKRSKLRAISTSLDEGSMPLPSYLLIHRDVRLSRQDIAAIKNWIRKTNDANNY